jgi:DNA-binding protein H-NS
MTQIIYTVAAAVVSPIIIMLLEYLFKERRERRRRAEETRRQMEDMRKCMAEIQKFKLLALKCVITNRELSSQARLEAYAEYKTYGGNSWVDQYVLQHLTDNRT